ncbi:MAG: hypothetical protein WKF73_18655 [Nocardioidaceae bacterium]
MGPLLGYLRGLGVAPQPVVAAPASCAEELVERYRGYLLVERGLQVKVARGYVDLVRPFIAARVRADGVELGALTAGEVTAFLVAASRGLAPKRTQRLATALRSLLRFWHVEGLIAGPLAQSVPKVAHRRAGLVRALEPAQVAAMLSGCERDSSAGGGIWRS